MSAKAFYKVTPRRHYFQNDALETLIEISGRLFKSVNATRPIKQDEGIVH